MTNADFEQAAQITEDKLGLTGQPRVMVFHEKMGRRHCHVVWSRIKEQEMKYVKLAFYKRKLNDISRELFLQHGWELPKGYISPKYSDPLNYSLAEWQQAKRAGEYPRVLKAPFKQSWAHAKNRKGFERALKNRGLWLARGNGAENFGE